MVHEYRHRVQLFEIGSYLKHYVDDHATEPFNSGLQGTLESYARYLLMNDYHRSSQMKTYLTRFLPHDHVEYITVTVHDMMVAALRAFLNLDEGESVVDVRVSVNYDIEILVEELDGAHLATA